MFVVLLFVLVGLSAIPRTCYGYERQSDSEPPVVVAILAKDKSDFLPQYLQCLEEQTYPKNKIHLWIRSNNNNDNTVNILKEWVSKVKYTYASIKEDYSNVPEPVQTYAQHEWNVVRFKVLGRIRQASVQYAIEKKAHYFVADCDNFIVPNTLSMLVATNMPVVAPLVISHYYYANYHAAIDANGYYADSPEYYSMYDGKIRGLVDVPVVHCTYLVRNEVLSSVRYDDGSNRYEYVIFSDSMRKSGVPQYLDTRFVYGALTLTDTMNEAVANFKRASDRVYEAISKRSVWYTNAQTHEMLEYYKKLPLLSTVILSKKISGEL